MPISLGRAASPDAQHQVPNLGTFGSLSTMTCAASCVGYNMQALHLLYASLVQLPCFETSHLRCCFRPLHLISSSPAGTPGLKSLVPERKNSGRGSLWLQPLLLRLRPVRRHRNSWSSCKGLRAGVYECSPEPLYFHLRSHYEVRRQLLFVSFSA